MSNPPSSARLRLSFAKGMTKVMGNVLLGWTYSPLPIIHKDMTGKTVLITGANAGIGFVLARELASMNANVYMACRSSTKGEDAIERIKAAHPEAKVSLLMLDTSSTTSCKAFARKWIDDNLPSIDILIHNAGAAVPPLSQPFTEDGFEYLYQTNFLSNFILTSLLAEKFLPESRIIFTSSAAAFSASLKPEFSLERTINNREPGFHHAIGKDQDGRIYANAKFMQLAFARALREEWASQPSTQNRLVVAFAPGYTTSSIFDGRDDQDAVTKLLIRWKGVMATPTEQGAATGIWLAVEDREVIGRGLFFDRLRTLTSSADLLSEGMMERLWGRWSADAEMVF